MSEDHVKVVCRIRPPNQRESSSAGHVRKCVSIFEPSNTVVLNSKPEAKTFTFDYAADENVTQEKMFEEVGLPIVHSCLLGYNGTILCYGQTGSGKTYTIFGNSIDTIANFDEIRSEPLRGLVPRVLEHLLDSANDALNLNANSTFTCKCSFYEIFQEKVFDLLEINSLQSMGGLSVREDSKEGVYVEGCSEHAVTCVRDAHAILIQGYQNRHVAETAMNRESSRSHAVLQLSIEISETRPEDGVIVKKRSRFTMVDLAGSERQKDTNATGDRLKEASVINKSLSTLGHVINTLADIAASGGRRHIHYRDSKLTFLLRDSLGGNSKTTLVATVSPAELCMAETLSTLKFAQRAKSIKNAAVMNEESSGSLLALQREIAFLKAQLANAPSAGFQSNSTKDDLGPLDQNTNSVTDTLLDALKRCQLSDQRRVRAEINEENLGKRLEQSEKNVMGIKMMLKMRESEIQRLKKKSAEISSDEFEDAVKTAVASAREELQCEILKYRLQIKDLERSISEFSGERVSDKWTAESEIRFNHEIISLIEEQKVLVENLSVQNRRIAEGKFAEEFGHTPQEVSQLKSRLAVSEKHLEEALTRLSQLQHGVVMLQRMLDESNTAITELQGQLEAEKEKSIASSNDALLIEELRREIAEKDDLILQLEGGMQKNDSELKEQLRQREGEFKDKLNLVMKDNVVLIKRCRDLESAVSDFQIALDSAVKSREAQNTQLEKCRFQIMNLESDYNEKISHMRDLYDATLGKYNSERDEKNVLIKKHDILAQKCSEQSQQIIDLESNLQLAKQELSQVKFEADNAIEDADNLYSQTQALIDERACLLATTSSTEIEMTGLKEKLRFLQDEKDRLDCLASKLQTQKKSDDLELTTLKALMEKSLASIAQLEFARNEHTKELDRLTDSCCMEIDALRMNHEVQVSEITTKYEEIIKSTAGQLTKMEMEVSLLKRNNKDLTVMNNASNTKIVELQEIVDTLRESVARKEKDVISSYDSESLRKERDAMASQVSELQNQLKQALQIAEFDRVNARSALASKEAEIQDTLQNLETEKLQLASQLEELQLVHVAMCGHQNNKQKIHQHMSLKKDLQDQTLLLKQQQEQIVQISFERDAARAESRKLRAALKDIEKSTAENCKLSGSGSALNSVPRVKAIPNSTTSTTVPNFRNENDDNQSSETGVGTVCESVVI